MLRRFLAAVVVVPLVLAAQAHAGAWALDRNKIAAFAGTTASTASRRYDGGGNLGKAVVFNKLLLQNWMEYGLTDTVTLFTAPEYVLAQSNMNGTGLESIRSMSIEAGLRVLLSSRIGMLSGQVSVKTAGAFDMSVSSSGEAGRQIEARLLWGRSFNVFRHEAFVDVEVAKRFIARPRPDEIVLEGTVGWWATRNNLLLVQSFDFFTADAVALPYQPYGLYKLQMSLVHRLSQHWSLQSGYFYSLAGRNIVKETGAVAMVWFKT